MEWIKNNPVFVGTFIKASLAILTIFGVSTTEASREAIVAAVMANAAMIAILTKKERAAVTPMRKVERLAQETGGNALKLLDRIKGVLTDDKLS